MYFCPFGFSDDSLNIKQDKKNRPYFTCEVCYHRVFIRSKRALGSMMAWSRVASQNPSLFAEAVEEGRRVLALEHERRGSETLENVEKGEVNVRD